MASNPGQQNFEWDANRQRFTINGQAIFGGVVGPYISPLGAGSIYFDSPSNRFKASENGGAPVNLLTGGGGGSAYTNVDFNGTPLPQETVLNFTSPLTATDNPGVATNLGITQATSSVSGYLSFTDWNTFNNKASGSNTINVTAPITGGGAIDTNPTISITQATTSTNGYLSSTDWNTFNNKISAVVNSDGSLTASTVSDTTTVSLNPAHANTWTGKQAFTTSATLAGLNLVPFAGDPSTPVNGDMWYNSTTGHFRAEENGTAKNVIVTSGSGSTAYNTIENNGVGVAQEETVNFIAGANVSLNIVDNPGVSTNVTINATGSGFSNVAKAHGSQSIPNSVVTTFTNFTVTEFDSNSIQTSSTNFTAPATGYYQVNTALYIPNGNGTGEVATYILVNGSYPGVIPSNEVQVYDAGADFIVQNNNIFSLTAGNVVTFQAFQNLSGGGSANVQAVLSIAQVG